MHKHQAVDSARQVCDRASHHCDDEREEEDCIRVQTSSNLVLHKVVGNPACHPGGVYAHANTKAIVVGCSIGFTRDCAGFQAINLPGQAFPGDSCVCFAAGAAIGVLDAKAVRSSKDSRNAVRRSMA